MTGRSQDDVWSRPVGRHGAAAPTTAGSPSTAGSISLPRGSDGSNVARRLDDGAAPAAVPAIDPRWSEAIRIFERDLLEQTLERTQGNPTHAARALGLQRTYLLKLIRELGARTAPARHGARCAPNSSPSQAAR